MRRLLVAWARLGCGTTAFRIGNRKFTYFLHTYNQTWSNERAVEVAVAKQWMRETSGTLLEIGNVMSHYAFVRHDVLDKYEDGSIGSRHLREDILGFSRLHCYERFLSISTLEHVGRDEQSGEPRLAIDALSALAEALGRSKKALITVPIGYNFELDGAIREIARMPHSPWSIRCMRRRDFYRWSEVSVDDAIGVQYGKPHPSGNGLFFLTTANEAGFF